MFYQLSIIVLLYLILENKEWLAGQYFGAQIFLKSYFLFPRTCTHLIEEAQKHGKKNPKPPKKGISIDQHINWSNR